MKGNNFKTSPEDLKFAVLATDTVLWTISDKLLLVRLIPVNLPPHFNNLSGLPGGLLYPKETALEAAVRHVTKKAGVAAGKIYFEQLYTFSEVDRDPRGRVVSVAYSGYVPWESLSTSERESGGEAYWCPANAIPKLAYDHKDILYTALERLRARIRYTTLMTKLMPKEFTLTELENAYELILGEDLDKRNFRKKLMALELVRKLNKERRGQKFRPAKLHSFNSSKVVPIEIL